MNEFNSLAGGGSHAPCVRIHRSKSHCPGTGNQHRARNTRLTRSSRFQGGRQPPFSGWSPAANRAPGNPVQAGAAEPGRLLARPTRRPIAPFPDPHKPVAIPVVRYGHSPSAEPARDFTWRRSGGLSGNWFVLPLDSRTSLRSEPFETVQGGFQRARMDRGHHVLRPVVGPGPIQADVIPVGPRHGQQFAIPAERGIPSR